MDKPAISIIMPIYNGEVYLRECLDSILGQTLKELQVLCIDDGSTDSSPTILREYAQRDNRIQIIHQQNLGAGPARNRGLKEARGEFIAFMDCDDFYPDSQILQRMYDSAKSTECKIVGGYHVDVKGSGWTPNSRDPVYKWAQKLESPQVLPYKDVQCEWNYQAFLFQTELLRKNDIIFPDYLRGEDPPFFVRAMDAAEEFCLMPEITYCYRADIQNIKWTQRKICDCIRSLIELLEFSKARKLDILHARTAARLEKDYYKLILDNTATDNPTLTCLLCLANREVDLDVAWAHGACTEGHLALMDGLAAKLADLWNGCVASAALRSEKDLPGVIKEQIGLLAKTWDGLDQPSPEPLYALIGDALAGLFQPNKLFLSRQALYMLLSSGQVEPYVRCCSPEAQKTLQTVQPAFEFYNRYQQCAGDLNLRVIHQADLAETPDVSVIIPVYNTQQYLRECLDSVVTQRGALMEIICVDDGSTDNSSAILEDYASRYSNITVLRQNNGGLSAARNAGIRAARGRYIQYLDSDDAMCKDAYLSLVSMMDEEDLQILYFNGDSFYETEELETKKRWYQTAYSKNQSDEFGISGAEYYIQRKTNDDLIVQACMYLMRREYLQQIGLYFPVGIVHEDCLFTILSMVTAQRVGHVSRSLYRRRVRDGSLSVTTIEFRHAFGYFRTGQELLTQSGRTELSEVTRQLLREEAHNSYQKAINKMLEIKETPQRGYYLALPEACDFYALVYAPFETKKKERERTGNATSGKNVSSSFESYRNTVQKWKAEDSDGSSVKKIAKQILPASYQKIDQLLVLQQQQTQLLLKAMEPDQERTQKMQAQMNQLVKQVQKISDELTCRRLPD